MMTVTLINPLNVDYVWDQVEPLVNRVLDMQAKYGAVGDEIFDCKGIYDHVKCGDGLLVVVHDGATIIASLVLQVIDTEVGRSLNLTTLGGSRIYEWRHLLLNILKIIAKDYNCKDIRVYMVRRGWQRCLKPYGFKFIGNRDYVGSSYPAISLNMENIE